jgi:MFS family permease
VWLFSGCFLLYSFSYLPLISFLPLLLVKTSNLTLGWASSIAALVILCNSVGSISAGFYLRRGYSPAMLMIVGALGSGLCAMFVFAPVSTTGVRIICAFAFSILGGLIPGVLFSTMPSAANHPSSTGLLIGLMMQLSGVGMLLGGVIIPGAIDYFTVWSAAGWVILFTASCCAFLAYLSGRPIQHQVRS